VVLIDTRTGAHRGDGPGSSFEWAVSAAASTSLYLLHAGYAVRLVEDTGAEVGGGADTGVADVEGLLLDAFAVAGKSRNTTVAAASAAMRRGGGEGLVIAILGQLGSADIDALSAVRAASTAAVAIMLDVSTWVARDLEPSQFAAQAARLRAAGWRVLPVARGTALDALWPDAATTSVSALSRSGAASVGGLR
jgi:uncharacterized protein (DUF58 family)